MPSTRSQLKSPLNGVLIEIDAQGVHYVATDGHALAVLHEKHAEPLGDDFKTVQIIVPREVAVKIKPLRKFYKHCYITFTDGANVNGTVTADCLFECVHGGDHSFTPIDGTFPDWRRVMPRYLATDGDSSQFDPALLAGIERCMREALSLNSA